MPLVEGEGRAGSPRFQGENKLTAAGRFGAAIGEVDDFTLSNPINGEVRLFNKTFQAIRKPMIPASLPAVATSLRAVSFLHCVPPYGFGFRACLEAQRWPSATP